MLGGIPVIGKLLPLVLFAESRDDDVPRSSRNGTLFVAGLCA
jgi:hypothetical protein